MNNNSKEELKEDLYMLSCIRKIEKVLSCRLMDVTAGNEFNRLLLVPCEEKLLIGECAASAEYKVNVACKNNSALQ